MWLDVVKYYIKIIMKDQDLSLGKLQMLVRKQLYFLKSNSGQWHVSICLGLHLIAAPLGPHQGRILAHHQQFKIDILYTLWVNYIYQYNENLNNIILKLETQ